MRAAIDWWVGAAQTGPWLLLDHFWAADQRYRGSPSKADVAIAMSFSGSMCIELIQPLDGHPSIYRDGIEKRGTGLHHLGLAVEDSDEALIAHQAKGYAEVFRAKVPSGGEVIYLENGVNVPCYLELIPATPGMEEMFTRYAHAARDWDGSEPIRPFG
jgi:hypothetical protein